MEYVVDVSGAKAGRTLHEVDVLTKEECRDVRILDNGHLIVELTALVQVNGGDVLSEDAE